VPSKEPGGPPNQRRPWCLCKLRAVAVEIHDATQPGDVVPVNMLYELPMYLLDW